MTYDSGSYNCIVRIDYCTEYANDFIFLNYQQFIIEVVVVVRVVRFYVANWFH